MLLLNLHVGILQSGSNIENRLPSSNYLFNN